MRRVMSFSLFSVCEWMCGCVDVFVLEMLLLYARLLRLSSISSFSSSPLPLGPEPFLAGFHGLLAGGRGWVHQEGRQGGRSSTRRRKGGQEQQVEGLRRTEEGTEGREG